MRGIIVNHAVISSLIDYSDSYVSKLFNRYAMNNPVSKEEAEYFEIINRILPSSASTFEELSQMLSHLEPSMVSYGIFTPGSASDIFINYHVPVMNNWVHSNDFFEIVYVEQGESTICVDGTNLHLIQGELCIMNPNALHKKKMKAETDFLISILLPKEIFKRSFYSILMENKELDRFFNNYMIMSETSNNYMVFHDTTTRVDHIIELLVEEFLRGKNASRLIMESTLIVLFGELMRNFHSSPFSQKLISYISENIVDISMEQVAKYFGYHKNYFPHLIKSETGRTFLELVTDIRMQTACSKLLMTSDSIENISVSVGYKSTASFYNHFYNRYNMTPKEYRIIHQ